MHLLAGIIGDRQLSVYVCDKPKKLSATADSAERGKDWSIASFAAVLTRPP